MRMSEASRAAVRRYIPTHGHRASFQGCSTGSLWASQRDGGDPSSPQQPKMHQYFWQQTLHCHHLVAAWWPLQKIFYMHTGEGWSGDSSLFNCIKKFSKLGIFQHPLQPNRLFTGNPTCLIIWNTVHLMSFTAERA